jgi:hypothetical protein
MPLSNHPYLYPVGIGLLGFTWVCYFYARSGTTRYQSSSLGMRDWDPDYLTFPRNGFGCFGTLIGLIPAAIFSAKTWELWSTVPFRDFFNLDLVGQRHWLTLGLAVAAILTVVFVGRDAADHLDRKYVE